MLTDEQVDYLLQIRDAKPPIPERTVRVMLSSLRWSPDEIEHGIAFLRKPPPTRAETEEARKAVAPVAPMPTAEPELPKPNLRQNPFPIGSPLFKGAAHRADAGARHRRFVFSGILSAFVLLLAGLLIYGYSGGF